MEITHNEIPPEEVSRERYMAERQNVLRIVYQEFLNHPNIYTTKEARRELFQRLSNQHTLMHITRHIRDRREIRIMKRHTCETLENLVSNGVRTDKIRLPKLLEKGIGAVNEEFLKRYKLRTPPIQETPNQQASRSGAANPADRTGDDAQLQDYISAHPSSPPLATWYLPASEQADSNLLTCGVPNRAAQSKSLKKRAPASQASHNRLKRVRRTAQQTVQSPQLQTQLCFVDAPAPGTELDSVTTRCPKTTNRTIEGAPRNDTGNAHSHSTTNTSAGLSHLGEQVHEAQLPSPYRVPCANPNLEWNHTSSKPLPDNLAFDGGPYVPQRSTAPGGSGFPIPSVAPPLALQYNLRNGVDNQNTPDCHSVEGMPNFVVSRCAPPCSPLASIESNELKVFDKDIVQAMRNVYEAMDGKLLRNLQSARRQSNSPDFERDPQDGMLRLLYETLFGHSWTHRVVATGRRLCVSDILTALISAALLHTVFRRDLHWLQPQIDVATFGPGFVLLDNALSESGISPNCLLQRVTLYNFRHSSTKDIITRYAKDAASHVCLALKEHFRHLHSDFEFGKQLLQPITDSFQHAFALRGRISLSPDRYEFMWFAAGERYNEIEMEPIDQPLSGILEPEVDLTLCPGVKLVHPVETSRIVCKAKVVVSKP